MDHLKTQTTGHWLSILEPADIWCADVFTWDQLFEHEAFRILDMVQETERSPDLKLRTTRCPIRIDGEVIKNKQGAPRLGQDTERLLREFSSPPSEGENDKP